MGEAISLFWRRSWDNIGHLVIFNMAWLTAAVPFFFAVVLSITTLFVPVKGEVRESQAPPVAAESIQQAEQSGIQAEKPSPEPAAGTESEAGTAVAAEDTAEETSAEESAAELPPVEPREFEWSARGAAALVFLVASWLLTAIVTGFVNWGMADLVEGYDFGGYMTVIRAYFKRGPVVRSVAILTLFAVTFTATMTNFLFYLTLVPKHGVVLLLMAGVMLWFAVFVVMVAAFSLPLSAQTDITLWQTFKAAATIALSYPTRSFFVVALAGLVFLIGAISMAGMGFFAVAAPLVLFNANVKVHLAEAASGEEATEDTRSPSESGL